MSEKIPVYFLEDVDMLLCVDFHGTFLFKYQISLDDPRIKFITSKSVVLITDDEGEAYIKNCYRDTFNVSAIANREVKKIYKRLSPIGKRRADKELERIKSVLDEDRKVKNKTELDKINIAK